MPLQVVVRGIDRKLERYLAVGRTRRPLRIEHCESDVLDVFDEWRRAVGVAVIPDRPVDDARGGFRPCRPTRPTGLSDAACSLPAHIDRVLTRATNQLAQREAAPGIHAALERMIADVDDLRHAARGARGETRADLVERLATIDQALIAAARTAAGSALEGLQDAARTELAPFKTRMAEAPFARALARAPTGCCASASAATVRFDQ